MKTGKGNIVILTKKGFTEHRIKAGFSMMGLAEEAKLHPATICYIEHGKRNPSPATAKVICDVLKQPFDVLFELKEGRP